MLVMLLVIALSVLWALGTALYSAYLETELDFPMQQKRNRRVKAGWLWLVPLRFHYRSDQEVATLSRYMTRIRSLRR